MNKNVTAAVSIVGLFVAGMLVFALLHLPRVSGLINVVCGLLTVVFANEVSAGIRHFGKRSSTLAVRLGGICIFILGVAWAFQWMPA